jgi:hypothetical protein
MRWANRRDALRCSQASADGRDRFKARRPVGFLGALSR